MILMTSECLKHILTTRNNWLTVFNHKKLTTKAFPFSVLMKGLYSGKTISSENETFQLIGKYYNFPFYFMNNIV